MGNKTVLKEGQPDKGTIWKCNFERTNFKNDNSEKDKFVT